MHHSRYASHLSLLPFPALLSLAISSLVGDVNFASAMPLAASGIGEPFVTASGVLALMTLWRCVYSLYLDPFGFKGLGFRRQQFLRELYRYSMVSDVRQYGSVACRLQLLS